ncbi:MAG: TetR/AcrR family transcriptional regulator [Parvibaculum sp.]
MTVSDKIPNDEHVDGRLNRSTRTRAAIVQALVELISQGVLIPTSEEVAEHAKVGLRTVFRHFEDMETLYKEVDRSITRMVQQDFDLMPVNAPLEERITLLIDRRLALYDRINPYVASTLARKWRSPFLERTYKGFAEVQRTYLIDMLPEIASLEQPLQKMLDQLCSFDVWNRMRNTQGHSQKTIAEMLDVSIRAVLKP